MVDAQQRYLRRTVRVLLLVLPDLVVFLLHDHPVEGTHQFDGDLELVPADHRNGVLHLRMVRIAIASVRDDVQVVAGFVEIDGEQVRGPAEPGGGKAAVAPCHFGHRVLVGIFVAALVDLVPFARVEAVEVDALLHGRLPDQVARHLEGLGKLVPDFLVAHVPAFRIVGVLALQGIGKASRREGASFAPPVAVIIDTRYVFLLLLLFCE